MKDNEGFVKAEVDKKFKSKTGFSNINLTRFTDQMGVCDEGGVFKNEF